MNVADSHPASFSNRELRDVLGCYPTGVAVIATCNAEGILVGLTCNSFSSVSLTPPLVLWSLALYSPALPVFLAAPFFSINVLSAGQIELSSRFSSRLDDRFQDVKLVSGIGGIPLIEGCAAHLECRSETRHYAGDHVIFIGHVLRFARLPNKPLVFSEGKYGAVT